MNQKKKLSILEFSQLTGIKRENLRYYDRIGLLSPEMRGENNYRYYSRRQLNTAYLIGILRGLGVGIEDIKRYSAEGTPQNALALLGRQEKRIQEEIRRLRETSKILQMYTDMMRQAIHYQESALFLEEKKKESIFLCPPIPAGMDEDEGSTFSYGYAEEHGVNLGYPQGTMVARESLLTGGGAIVESFYFKVGSGGNAEKPAGRYAVIYGRCDPWEPEPLYRRLMAFIREQGLCVCGNSYEEYPLGDIAEQEGALYCIRVEIPVTDAAEEFRQGASSV